MTEGRSARVSQPSDAPSRFPEVHPQQTDICTWGARFALEAMLLSSCDACAVVESCKIQLHATVTYKSKCCGSRGAGWVDKQSSNQCFSWTKKIYASDGTHTYSSS